MFLELLFIQILCNIICFYNFFPDQYFEVLKYIQKKSEPYLKDKYEDNYNSTSNINNEWQT